MTDDSQGYILALDLGTTGNRAIIFDQQGEVVGQAYEELKQYYPEPGWLEHDPQEIWHDTFLCIEQALYNGKITFKQIKAIGLTVQRETCLLWDKTTGQPLYRAIVWQDRRTSSFCNKLKAEGKDILIQECTGLVVDAYFSATKLNWLLEKAKKEQKALNIDNLCAGTIDSWILWKLTKGKVHATDHSNASRTMLMNIREKDWDEELLKLFSIPREIMPEIKPSLGIFGTTDPELFGTAIPIAAVFGDQQAALYAHGCDRPGLLKCTYGTGSFLVAHTGQEIVRSEHQLLSTVAWTTDTETNYALEGAMFTAGACIQWLRDGLNLIKTASETDTLARQVSHTDGVYFVPALSGLGTPHWDMSARGAFFGITGGVTKEHIVRAVLEAIAYQVKEVVDAINQDSDESVQLLKVDGGASKNDFLMQFQANALGIPVERPVMSDATAQGAAYAAGLTIGFWDSYADLTSNPKIDRLFTPDDHSQMAEDNFADWKKAVQRAKNWID